MKQNEIKKCAKCQKGVMHTGVPLFWKISAERFAVNLPAVQRQTGLEMMMGSPALARVLSPDEDIATPITKKIEFILCEDCAMQENMLPVIFMLMEDTEQL